jgi:hypothetical protein
MRALAMMHLLGNAVLLWLGYYWLGLGESRAAALAWSGFVALAIVLLTCCLHGSAFAFFARPKAGLRGATATASRHLLPLIVTAALAVGLYLLVDRLAPYGRTGGFQAASYLTLKMRRPVKPANIVRVVDAALWFVRWMVVPALLLPIVAGVTSNGWRGLWPYRTTRVFWLQTLVLMVCAFRVPLWLLGWAPRVASFGLEMTSFVVRAAVAYLLFVAAWLLLVFLTSAGRPVLTQRKTVASV